jgi:hypothetical protein
MADPVQHAAYIAALPGPVLRDVGVVIHHTDASIHAAPTAFVSYDAVIGSLDSGVQSGAHPAARHFDVKGVEFQLPQENSSTAIAQTPRPMP